MVSVRFVLILTNSLPLRVKPWMDCPQPTKSLSLAICMTTHEISLPRGGDFHSTVTSPFFM